MFDDIIRVIARVLKYATALLLVMLACIVFGQVILRSIFKSGVNWNEEVSRFLFSWLIFIGTTAAIIDRSHMAMTFLEERFPSTAVYVEILTWILSGAFFSILFWYGIEYVKGNWMILSSALRVPMGLVYMVIPVCSFICVVFVVYQVYCKIVGKEVVKP